MSVKVIVSDLDGTLLQDDHVSISEENMTALKKASERGVHIGIATGRNRSLASKVIDMLPFIRFVVCSNGAYVYDVEKDTVEVHGIDYNVWLPIYEFMMKHQCLCEVYYNGKAYVESRIVEDFRDPDLHFDFVAMIKRHSEVVEDPAMILKGKAIEKINVLKVPVEARAEVEAFVSSTFGIAVTSSIPGNLEITRGDVNKGVALARLCEEYGVDRSEVMAFGDSGNDKEMLEWAGLSYAMENATDVIRAAAANITKSNADHGVAAAVNAHMIA